MAEAVRARGRKRGRKAAGTDELEKFDKPFHELLDEMAKQIDPRESRRISRRGLGRVIDIAILLRRGFEQSWQFIVIIQALFIFLGLSPQVSEALAQLGIHISGTVLGILAVAGIAFFFAFGLALLLYGGSQRSASLVDQKQNPAERMSYQFYRAMARWARRQEERLERMEERLEEAERRR